MVNINKISCCVCDQLFKIISDTIIELFIYQQKWITIYCPKEKNQHL